MYGSIVIDLEIVQFLNARCFFPEWKLYAGPLYVTAKLVNDFGSQSSNNSDYTHYGGYFQQISNTLTISATVPATSALSLS